MTNNIQDFLGVHLTELQTPIALALSAGGVIKELPKDEQPSPSRKHYIRHPNHTEDIIIASITLRSLKKKGVIDENLIFTQMSLAGTRGDKGRRGEGINRL